MCGQPHKDRLGTTVRHLEGREQNEGEGEGVGEKEGDFIAFSMWSYSKTAMEG